MRFFLFLALACGTACGIHSKSFDPTGTYEMVSEQTVENEEVYGYSGAIQVKSLENNRLAITLGVNKGAPGSIWGFL